jgi:hypothetical protein
VNSIVSPPARPAIPPALRWSIYALLLAIAAWRKPLWGGIGLVVAGLAAALLFRNWGAFTLLVVPAIGFGAFYVFIARRERVRA